MKIDSQEKIDKIMQSMEDENFDLKADIGYKYLINWCLKKTAETFMFERMERSELLKMWSRLHFMKSFIPYINVEIKITYESVVFADKKNYMRIYKILLDSLRNIMEQMDKNNLLLQSFASIEWSYKDKED